MIHRRKGRQTSRSANIRLCSLGTFVWGSAFHVCPCEGGRIDWPFRIGVERTLNHPRIKLGNNKIK